MDLLLCNDDGIDASGIAALEEALAPLGTVWVVAPESEQSAASHALTMHKPLRAHRHAERHWAISGTPADCIYLGLNHLLPGRPDVVVSGINRGSNLGNDVFYSGTVAAAMEAALHGLPATAVSLHLEPGDRERHWATAGGVARRVVEGLRDHPLADGVFLNVNVPNCAADAVRGLRATALGRRRYAPRVDLRTDPRGRHYYWIGGSHQAFVPLEGTDGPAIEAGWATVTPLRPDLTAQTALDALRAWSDA